MRLARIRCAPAGTAPSENRPSSRVRAPSCVPTTETVTLARGCCETESTTRPLTTPVCACATAGDTTAAAHTSAANDQRTTETIGLPSKLLGRLLARDRRGAKHTAGHCGELRTTRVEAPTYYVVG